MEQEQPVQVNHTVDELNKKLGDLGSIIQQKGSALKMKQVTTIIPGQESKGEVTVSIDIVQGKAKQLVDKFQYNMPSIPSAQQEVNILYDGLVKAIDVGNQFNPWAGGRRRGTKRRGTKRRGIKRRGTKRRRSSIK